MYQCTNRYWSEPTALSAARVLVVLVSSFLALRELSQCAALHHDARRARRSSAAGGAHPAGAAMREGAEGRQGRHGHEAMEEVVAVTQEVVRAPMHATSVRNLELRDMLDIAARPPSSSASSSSQLTPEPNSPSEHHAEQASTLVVSPTVAVPVVPTPSMRGGGGGAREVAREGRHAGERRDANDGASDALGGDDDGDGVAPVHDAVCHEAVVEAVPQGAVCHEVVTAQGTAHGTAPALVEGAALLPTAEPLAASQEAGAA